MIFSISFNLMKPSAPSLFSSLLRPVFIEEFIRRHWISPQRIPHSIFARLIRSAQKLLTCRSKSCDKNTILTHTHPKIDHWPVRRPGEYCKCSKYYMFARALLMKLDDNSANAIASPPPGYIPPIGATDRTWPNIYRNMKHMDFCKDQFDLLANRMHCITILTNGPFLN